MTISEQYDLNLKAINELIQTFKTKNQPDKQVLKSFNGYGNLKDVLIDPYNDKLWTKSNKPYQKKVKELHQVIKDFTLGNQLKFDKMLESIKSSTLTAYYTPIEIVNPIINNIFLQSKPNTNLKILEPSCGNGIFFESIIKNKSKINNTIELHGVEKDSLSASLTGNIYPEVNLQKTPLETANLSHNSFNVVLSNIPFGSFKVYDPSYRKELKNSVRIHSQKKIHNYFFAKGMDLLKPEGILAYITSTGVADSENNTFIREHLIKESSLVSAFRLPNSAFKNSGTKVNTDILIFQKRQTPLINIQQEKLTELDKKFLNTTEITLDGISSKINTVFIDDNKLNYRVLGNAALGYLHNKEIIIIEPNKFSDTLNKISTNLESLIELDYKKYNSEKNKNNYLDEEKSKILTDYILNQIWKGNITEEQAYELNFFIENLYVEKNTIIENKYLLDLATELTLNKEELLNLLNRKLESITKEETQVIKEEVIISQQLDLFTSTPIKENRVKQEIKPKLILENTNINFNSEKWDKVKNYIQENDLYIIDDTVGKISFSEEGPQLIPTVHKNPEELLRYKKGTLVLIAFKELIHYETENYTKDVLEKQREKLNILYDNFTLEYGLLNSKENKAFIELTNNKTEFLSLEIKNEKTLEFEKADIFFKSTYQAEIDVKLNINDAIFKSLNKVGNIDLNYINSITNLSHEQIIKEGLELDLIYPEPNFDKNQDFTKFKPSKNINYNWTIKEDFVSGAVRHKISQIEKYGKSIYEKYGYISKHEEHIKKLKENDLPYLNIEEISPKLGESWIPKTIFEKFAEELFKVDCAIYKNKDSHVFTLKTFGFSPIMTQEYKVETIANKRINGKDLFIEALAGTKPKIYYTVPYSDGTKQTFIDKKAMTSANLKINKINNEFTEFIKNDKKLVEQLENIYNNTQNLNVVKTFNGEHLTLPGLTGFEPYTHQKNAIWQNIKNDGGVNDHIVGAGKTLVMCATAMELKRLGISNKSLIIALKANTEAIYNDFKKAYPKAKLLWPKDTDFTPEKRQAFFNKMANNDWDAIIMTHNQFYAIPQSREIQQEVLKNELKNIESDLEFINGEESANKRQLRGLRTRIENTKADLARLSDSIFKDPDMLTFDKFGFGHLIVDESHTYKNLLYSTRFDRVAGLGPKEGNKRTLNLLYAVRTLQKQKGADKGITFCSGTTISNSMVELYSIFKYLAPKELEKRGMTNFDAWARTYANVSTEYELTVTNEVKSKERFREYNKVPELSNLYRSISNIANDNNIKLDKPELNNILINIEPTELQQEYSQELINAVKNENFSYFGQRYDSNQLQAKMLIATNIAAKMSLDVRFIDENLTPDNGSKLLVVAQNVAKIYEDSTHYKGTQLVFCDIGTPNSKNKDSFNAYDALKEILIDRYNIDENQIDYIHNHNTDKRKEKLFKRFNKGEFRILIGSSEKMGVGVNVQERIVAMHNVTIPWAPHMLTQRYGRGARQGNWAAKKYFNNKVNNYTYATKGTLDAYKYFLVDLKQKFIDQIKDDSIKTRNIDEGEGGIDGKISPQAFIAQLSGKTELIEKQKVDQKISDVETKISVLNGDFKRTKTSIELTEKKLPLTTELLNNLEKDKVNYQKNFKLSKDNLPVYEFTTVFGDKLSKQKEIGKYIKAFIKSKENIKNDQTITLGHVGDFQLKLNFSAVINGESETFIMKRLITVSTKTEQTYSYGNIIPKNEGNLSRIMYDSLKNIETKINSYKRAIKSMKESLEVDKLTLTKIDLSKYDNELKDLIKQSEDLGRIIELDNDNIETNLQEEIYNLYADDKIQDAEKLLDKVKSKDKLNQIKEFLINHPAISYTNKDLIKINIEEQIKKRNENNNQKGLNM